MAEVDARNKHYTKIMLKGDSPVKTHFLILNPLPVKSRSRLNEKIDWSTSWFYLVQFNSHRFKQIGLRNVFRLFKLNFTFSTSLLQCRAIAAISRKLHLTDSDKDVANRDEY